MESENADGRPPMTPTTMRIDHLKTTIERQEYASAIGNQLAAAVEKKGPGDIAALLRSNGTWTV